MSRDLVKRAARIAFWAAAALAYVMALLPGDPHVFEGDKLNHMLAFGTIAFLARLGWSRGRAALIALALIGFGIFIELSQALPIVGRDASLLDVVADAVAVAAGLAAGAVLLALIRRLQPG